MGAIRREILDPDTEEDVVVYEAPLERVDGTVSRRLKLWIFESASGGVRWVEMHRTANLGEPTEIELEELYRVAQMENSR